jgi:hypothetical protein
MHGDNVRKAIKDTDSRNKITQGVNDYAKTNPLNFSGKQWPLEKSMKTNKPTKYIPKAGETNGEKPGEHIKYVINKVDKKNAENQGANDHDKSTGKEPTRNQNVNPLGGKAKGHKAGKSPLKHRYAAGEGSTPSGTNTHLPGKRKPDGGFYSAGCR